MKSSKICQLFVASLVSVISFAGTFNAWAQEPFERVNPLPDSQPVVIGDARAIIQSVLSVAPRVDGEQPEATSVRPRGSATEVYPKVAPAVVLVTTPIGHGTGFFISEDGWLLTNAHVVEDAEYSHQKKGNVVSVRMGQIGADGWMEASQTPPLSATIFRVSPRKDLALLKLNSLPPDVGSVPFLRLSQDTPKPGSQCVAVGHPGIGSLWSVREGQVTGSGQFPADQAGLIASLMGLSNEERKSIEAELAADGSQKKVFQSNCGISSGDSGGPLVNEHGEVVAVTFAIRTAQAAASLSLHIHLDEVRDFISNFPDSADLMVPSAYPSLEYDAKPIDTDGDGQADAMMLLSSASSSPLGLQLRLTGLPGKNRKNNINKLSASRIPDWQPNFSLYTLPTLTVLYDRNGDGQFDLIFRDEDGDGTIDTRYRLTNGEWSVDETKEAPISSNHFSSNELGRAFGPWMKDINSLMDMRK